MHEKLLRAITEAFPHDRTRPGIVTSHLNREGRFYASVCRYSNCGEKQVVVNASEDTLENTLKELSKNLLGYLGRGKAIDVLAEAIKE